MITCCHLFSLNPTFHSHVLLPSLPPVPDRVQVPDFQISLLITPIFASVLVDISDVFPWSLTIFARYPDFFTPTQLLLRTFKLQSFIGCRTFSPMPLLTTSGFCRAPRGLRQHYRL